MSIVAIRNSWFSGKCKMGEKEEVEKRKTNEREVCYTINRTVNTLAEQQNRRIKRRGKNTQNRFTCKYTNIRSELSLCINHSIYYIKCAHFTFYKSIRLVPLTGKRQTKTGEKRERIILQTHLWVVKSFRKVKVKTHKIPLNKHVYATENVSRVQHHELCVVCTPRWVCTQ